MGNLSSAKDVMRLPFLQDPSGYGEKRREQPETAAAGSPGRLWRNPGAGRDGGNGEKGEGCQELLCIYGG